MPYIVYAPKDGCWLPTHVSIRQTGQEMTFTPNVPRNVAQHVADQLLAPGTGNVNFSAWTPPAAEAPAEPPVTAEASTTLEVTSVTPEAPVAIQTPPAASAEPAPQKAATSKAELEETASELLDVINRLHRESDAL